MVIPVNQDEIVDFLTRATEAGLIPWYRAKGMACGYRAVVDQLLLTVKAENSMGGAGDSVYTFMVGFRGSLWEQSNPPVQRLYSTAMNQVDRSPQRAGADSFVKAMRLLSMALEGLLETAENIPVLEETIEDGPLEW
jgi:hypothetical protein